MPTRNHFGIIGPIPKSEFEGEHPAQDRRQPLHREQGRQTAVLTITQSTYDGVLYNVEEIKDLLDGRIDTLHFDEAWLPHAAFHEFYGDYHAIGADRPRCQDSMMFATQSTHKLLAGLSQASQVLVQDPRPGQARLSQLQRGLLMHLDIAAVRDHRQLRCGGGDDGGPAAPRWSRSRSARRWISAAPCARWTRSSADPTGGSRSGAGLPLRGRHGLARRTGRCGGERWHGFGQLAEGFNMLDPIKATVITPGLDVDGDFADWGIPAGVLTKYLAEHGIVVEKTGLYSFFIMFPSASPRAAGTPW